MGTKWRWGVNVGDAVIKAPDRRPKADRDAAENHCTLLMTLSFFSGIFSVFESILKPIIQMGALPEGLLM